MEESVQRLCATFLFLGLLCSIFSLIGYTVVEEYKSKVLEVMSIISGEIAADPSDREAKEREIALSGKLEVHDV